MNAIEQALNPPTSKPESFRTGVGIYSLGEASRLVACSPQNLKRWMFGERRSKAGTRQGHLISPLWDTQFRDSGRYVIGFHDLLEVRFVQGFIAKGVDLRVVRKCADVAREMFSSPYPFTSRRFLTDGRTIFHDAIEGSDSGLTDLSRRQRVFDSVIRPSLYDGIEFDADGAARRWYPVPQSKTICLDPDLSFGKPILTESAIPTRAIFAAYLAEGKQRSTVARIFDVSPTSVDSAVRFEQQLAH